ncbi:MAG: hypothetical protein V4787_13720 [Pseudomonadota bacterium]
MLRSITGALLAIAGTVIVTACSPTFNWRDVRVEPTGLKAQLPCKPEHNAREVPMAGRQVSLEVLGCDTGGATFAVLTADIGDAARAGEVLAQWKTATLANMRSTASREIPFAPRGAQPMREAVQVVASGQRADGSAVEGHAAYFAQGARVFQAVIYSDKLRPEVADAFFSGLQFE